MSDTENKEGILEKEETETEFPRMYRVLLRNDNYTTMDFVVEVLVKIFHMDQEKAIQVMMDVHKTGKGECGIYTRDIAATKTAQVRSMAEQAGFPLKCFYEEA